MSNGIKQSDCKFYVNEEERTIVCVIENTQDMVLDYIMDHFNFPDLELDAAYGKLREELKMPRSFIGKAVCSENDEWDVELGCLIAFSRMKNKVYTSFFKRANLFVQTIDRRLNEIISNFNDFGLNLENKREALEAAIEHQTNKEGDD